MSVSVRLVLGLAAAVAALALFLWLADFVEDKAAVPFDASVRGWVHAHSNPTLTSFMRLMSLIGSPAFLVAFSLIAFLILLRVAHWPREALLFLVAMTGGFVLDGVLKVVFHRARPPSYCGTPEPASYSFPSGHASAAFFAAALLRDGAPAPLVYVAAATVASSRVHVGMHHASDVVAGAIVGAALGEVARHLFPIVPRASGTGPGPASPADQEQSSPTRRL